MNKIGIDLGGTKVEGIVIDDQGNELFRKRLPNGKEKGYEVIIATIAQLYEELKAVAGSKYTLGVCTPGCIDKLTGKLKNCNIMTMNGHPLLKDLRERLQHDLIIENDANCFALAEAKLGAGKGKELVFGVILGTGVGGGIVHHGKVIRGLREAAGEWGHSTINYDNGPEWTRGVNGVVEAYLSGTGAAVLHEKATGRKWTMEEIIAAYRKGDKEAGAFMDNFLEWYGISVSNIIKFLDPDVIVLGGGLSNIDELYSLGGERIAKYNLNNELYTPVVKNEYGDSAGVFGAALTGI